MKVTDLGNLEGILCTTKEECHAILQLMHDAGLKRSNGISYLKVQHMKYLNDGGQVYMPYLGIYASKSLSMYSHLYPASDFIDTPTSSADRIMDIMVELGKPREGGLGLGNKGIHLREPIGVSDTTINTISYPIINDAGHLPLVETDAEYGIRTKHSDPIDTDDTNRIVTGDSPVTNPYLNIFS